MGSKGGWTKAFFEWRHEYFWVLFLVHNHGVQGFRGPYVVLGVKQGLITCKANS